MRLYWSVLFGVAVTVSLWGQAQVAPTANKKVVKPVHFEKLTYPTDAVPRNGTVVIKAALDKSGRVKDADAISGEKTLIALSLSNIKTWSFEPSDDREAIVVYNYRVLPGLCKSTSSFFNLEQPNLATVTICAPSTAVVHSVSTNSEVVEDEKEVAVLEFEEMTFPRLAEVASLGGVVVLQAKLDDSGQVLEAVPLSGHGMLIPDAVANLKKWRFHPNSHHVAIVVYHFTFPCGAAPENQSQFVLSPPNFVTITGTRMSVQ